MSAAFNSHVFCSFFSFFFHSIIHDWCILFIRSFVRSLANSLCHSFVSVRYTSTNCALFQLRLLFSISTKRLNECAVNFFLLQYIYICVCFDARVIMFCLFAVAFFYFILFVMHSLDLLRSIV